MQRLTGASWRKSSYSSAVGENCVEAATGLRGIVPIRDSKNPAQGAILLTGAQWQRLTTHIKTL